ncbi:hypothetical protein LJR245_001615 [Rhizobium leguminosarum]
MLYLQIETLRLREQGYDPFKRVNLDEAFTRSSGVAEKVGGFEI